MKPDYMLTVPSFLRSSDLRSVLGVAPSTFYEIFKKVRLESDGQKGHGVVRHVAPEEVRQILQLRGYQYPASAKVISFMMCKGGVGKTTSSFFVSQRLAAYGAKVLAIDADPQGNLTYSFDLAQYGLSVSEKTPILVDVLEGKTSVEDSLLQLTPYLHLLPSTLLNSNLESRIREKYRNVSTPMRALLKPLLSQYEYIFIDCAPALNLTNTAMISASTMVILPVAPDAYSQIGMNQTLAEIHQIEKDFNFFVEKRILFTKFDAREFTSMKYLGEIAEKHGDKQFSTSIRICADVKNAIAEKTDLFSIRQSSAKEDYDHLAQEVMGLSVKRSARSVEGKVR